MFVVADDDRLAKAWQPLQALEGLLEKGALVIRQWQELLGVKLA
jgi:hypothetical protein